MPHARSPEALPEPVLARGTLEPAPKSVELRAGPLSMVFEPEGAFLRYVRLDDREVLRGVYVAIRDRNWGTVPPRMSNLRVEKGARDFRLVFDAECREREIDFLWRGTIAGEADGTVVYAMDGVARSTFLRNRIGFCALHPIQECAGRPCVVEGADGRIRRGEFPRHVSPHQPFKEVRAISYEVLPGLHARVLFEGDVFETEDQRNWTDASFKTYCTQLYRPFPIEVVEETKITQSVTLTLHGETRTAPKPGASAREVVFEVKDGPAAVLPGIGLCAASHGEPLTGRESELLKALNLSHLRVDLRPSEPGYESGFGRLLAEASTLGVPLEAALFLSYEAEEELRVVAEGLERLSLPRIARWLVFQEGGKPAPKRTFRLARERLSDLDPEAAFGTGTDAFFAELNRERPSYAGPDFVCYSISPQVHASDHASMVETLEAQAETVTSARRFTGGLPVVVSPVTLRPRSNPVATDPEPEPALGELPPQVDPRQMSLFAAGWTLGSVKYLSEGGARAATYYETTGWRGVLERERGSPLPERFPSIPGSVFPVYHAFADICGFAGGEVVPSRSSDPQRVEGIALRKGDRTRVLLANLGPEPRKVRLAGPVPEEVRVRCLDTGNAEWAMRSPESFRAVPGEQVQIEESGIELKPYSIARLDWREYG